MAGDSVPHPAAATVAQLEKTRTAYKGQLTRLETHVSDHETGVQLLTEPLCEQFTLRVQAVEAKINDINEKIFIQTPEEDMESACDDAHELELRVLNILSRLQEIKNNFPSSVPSSATPSGAFSTQFVPQANHVKLPSFDLPKFSGAFEDWLNFQDIFVATIDSHTALTDVQKLQYLKSCVQGEASSLISSYPLTGDHYAQAWNKLVNHYHDKRRIALAIYKKFASIQPLKMESASGLRKMLMTIDECMDKWSVLGYPVLQWDFLLVCHIMDRLDPVTKRSWTTSLKDTEMPTYKDTCKFLNTYISGLETNRDPKPAPTRERKFAASHHTASSEICPVCENGNHLIFRCPRFNGYTPEERISKVKSLGNCTICLQSHPTKDCVRDWKCRKCGKTHNSLLHIERKSQDVPSTSGNSNSNTNSNSNSNTHVVLHNTHRNSQSDNANNVLFMTAKVQLINPVFNSIIPARAFLDSGSEISIVDDDSVKLLGLKKYRTDVQISGLAMANVSRVKYKVYLVVKSLVSACNFQVEAMVLPRVTMSLPRFSFQTTNWPHLDGLTLADPDYNVSSKINILLGADICFSIMRAGIRQGPRLTPTAQNSILGWLLAGKVKDFSSTSHVTVNHFLGQEVDEILERFWRLETVPTKQHFSREEKSCELHFSNTIACLDNGRFQVRRPFRDNTEQLGESRTMAVQRLLSLEKRFVNFPKQKIQYIDFMNEYITMRHLTEVVLNNECKGYYLPHNFVLKDNNTTTRLRVVFDGSAKTSFGLSLNNCLIVGPTVQPDLFTLLLRFRFKQVAIKADIAKMCRQFAVHPDDAKYQWIVWRESPNLPIRAFQLDRVTSGTSAAPFLATRCLNQLPVENLETFLMGAKAVEESFNGDDLIDSVNTEQQAICIFNEVSSMLSAAQLDIRKWASNSSKFLKTVPKELHEKETSFNGSDNIIYALVVQLNSGTNCCYYSFDNTNCARNLTKRQLLSQFASVFSPIGFIAPLTLRTKLIFQSLWKTKVYGDGEIPASLQFDWSSYIDDLRKLNSLAIPRWVKSAGSSDYLICGFSDVSEKAYGACLYVFVCLTTCFIHLKAVTDMTAEGFLACFKRFAGRRGKQVRVYSYCGTNSVGAKKEIRAVLRSTGFNNLTCHNLADLGVSCHFNPPAAPHQGRPWKPGVKSVKFHFRRIVGSTHMTLEEFQSLLCSIEAILKSRLLCPRSVDPLDFEFLTPGHFFIGRNFLSLPESDVSFENAHRLSHLQVVSKFSKLIWERWFHEYLVSLQQRFKWTRREESIQIDELVVIQDENLEAAYWRMGRVTQVHPGSDGLVRVVTLRTATGSMQRPITKVSPLLFSEEMNREYTLPRVNDDAELNLQTVRV